MRGEYERIRQIFQDRPEIVAVYLFGSFDTPWEREDSDVDLALLIRPEVWASQSQNLRKEYDRLAPSISPRPVQLVVLNSAPLVLRWEVFRKGRLLWCRDERYRKTFLIQSMLEYLDFQPLEDAFYRHRFATLQAQKEKP